MMKKLQFVSILSSLLLTGISLSGQSQNDTLLSTHKKIGIGINPLRFATWYGKSNSDGYQRELRGTLSLFGFNSRAEIAFPVTYMFGKADNLPWRVFYTDVTYRKFPKSISNGFYYSAGLRYAYFKGEHIVDTLINHEATSEMITQSKIGIYAGIGYRHITKKGLYFGTNIILGTYISKNTPNISRADEVPLNFILGCDFFEIGYSF
jgi:hypothetical protein